jgi:large subunit ribosomal protein L15
MEEFNISKPQGATRGKKVLGRGAGTGHGSTAGRGSKGQNARSGGRTRIGFEGGQMPLYRRIARRGFSNYPFKEEYTTVAVGALGAFADGETVSRESLVEKKIVRRRTGPIKILGNGVLSRKLVVDVDKVTAGARRIIEAAGGQVVGAAPEQAGKAAKTGKGGKAGQPGKTEPDKPGQAAGRAKGKGKEAAAEAADASEVSESAEPAQEE